MWDWLVDLAKSSWTYPIIGGVILFDGLVGVLPSEVVLHAAGVGAARGGHSLLLLILVAWVAAMIADLLAHWIGGRWGTTLRDWLTRRDKLSRSGKTGERFDSVRGQLDERPWIISVARFVPGLRTATMYSAGSLEFPRGRFLAYEAPGALAWAAYNVLIGYFFGRVFQDSPFWVPFAVAAGVAALLSGAFEIVRRTRLKVG